MDRFSFLNAAHTAFFADLYEQYLQNPDSVEPSWRSFFQGFDFAQANYGSEEVAQQIAYVASGDSGEISEKMQKEFNVLKLIEGYRTRGHLFTKTNPVRDRRVHGPSLALENFGLSQADLNTVFDAAKMVNMKPSSLADIIKHLENVYCQSIGVEFMYIRDPKVQDWIKNRLDINDNQPNFSADQKKHILKKLNEAVSFENFLHTKYVGQKRFSLEGCEAAIPALDALIEGAADRGVEQFVMGMAHRGRLNVLANIFGKNTQNIFSEFDGKDYDEDANFDGDVKYHLGLTSDRVTDSGKKINLNLAPNPSHLETVGAVIEGITRAKQDRNYPNDFSKVLPIAVHGDAAVAGQGIVYEIIQMAKLDGYKTGGTIHLVINNQVGFTTNYLDARSSTYCTDVAKVTLSPVLHVNSDDAEAVVHAMSFALDFRMHFGRDVFIDLLGYRKYGHNEGDEPSFTQPLMYKLIDAKRSTRNLYTEALIGRGDISSEQADELAREYQMQLEAVFAEVHNIEPEVDPNFKAPVAANPETLVSSIDEATARTIAATQIATPEGFSVHPKLSPQLAKRVESINDASIDWSTGEMLAFGSLLKEGRPIRLAGQDARRGTFSNRHAVIVDKENGNEWTPLRALISDENQFFVVDSLLSEYAAMGFEYGYSVEREEALVLWEGQFGDFANGAQTIIDEFISSALQKWGERSSVVLLLPHGYEGQGPDHSSGRIERYLQLCAEQNMTVAQPSSPASYFHLLRWHAKNPARRPMIVFTPKSMLRLKAAASALSDFTSGHFQPVIADDSVSNASRVIFCSGKVYHDLVAERTKLGEASTAIVRVELLYPLPVDEMVAEANKHPNANLLWVQDEPANQGPWSHIALRTSEQHGGHGFGSRILRRISRRATASPATGNHHLHEDEQKALMLEAFTR